MTDQELELSETIPKKEVVGKHSNFRLGISVFLLCAILGVGLFNRLMNPRVPQNTSPRLSTTSVTPTTAIDCNKYKYQNQTQLDLTKTVSVPANLKNQILLKMENEEYIKKLIGRNEGVKKIKYHEPTQQIAYITGLEGYEDPTGFMIAHLFDVKTGIDKEVFRFQSKKIPQDQMLEVDQLRNVGFSPDGKEIFITSNSVIWGYTIDSEQLREIYTNSDPKSMSAFKEPYLSPDKNTLLIMLGYYEGFGSATVSLSNGAYKKLPFDGYVYGKLPLGWYGQDIVVNHYGYDEKNPRVCLHSVTGTEKKCYPGFTPETFQSFVKFSDNHVIYIETREEISDQQVCAGYNNLIKARTNFTTVYDLDLAKSSLTPLLSVDSTGTWETTDKSIPNYSVYQTAMMEINGKTQAVIWLRVKGEDKFLISNSDSLNDVSVLRFE
jgi:hypothetical protein